MKRDSSANFDTEVIANCHGKMRGDGHMLCLLAHSVSQLNGMILVTTLHFFSNLPGGNTMDVLDIAVMDHKYKLDWTRMPITCY